MKNWEGLEEAVVVADAGSFVGGARILNVSTSHISRAIAQLEERIGVRIFNRTTRRVSLTASGTAFVDQARRLIEDRENLLTSVRGDGEVVGELKITCSSALGEQFIAPIARQYAIDHPRLNVALSLDNRLVDIIAEGFDLAIRTGHVSDKRLVGRQLASRTHVTCASPEYLAKHGTPMTPEDLADHECLLGSITTWLFLVDDKPVRFTPAGRWHCNSGSTVVDAALSGMGICQLPSYYVEEEVRKGRLIPILSKYQRAPEPILAVYPHRRHLAPKVRQFVAVLEEKLKTNPLLR